MSPQYNSCRPGAGAQSIVHGSTMYILHEHICAYLQIGAAAAVHVVSQAGQPARWWWEWCTYVPNTSFMSYLSSTVGVLDTLTSSLGFSLALGFPNCIPRGMMLGDALLVSLVISLSPRCLTQHLTESSRQPPTPLACSPRAECARNWARSWVSWQESLRPWVGTFHWISAPTLGHWGRGARGDILTGPGAEEWWIFLSENIIPWWCQRNSQEILYKNNFCLNLEKL